MYIGVDIGGTNVKIGIISKLGRVISNLSFKTRMPRSCESLIDEIIENINTLCENANIPLNDIKGIGVGAPGVIDSRNGVIVRAVNLGWNKVDLVRQLKAKINKNIKLENDANCAALAESKFGIARDYKNIVFITIGTGIGSGIIIDKKLYTGSNGAAGECGHMIIKMGGEKCSCGNQGCWEVYASAGTLKRRVLEMARKFPECKINEEIEKQNKAPSVNTIFSFAKKGDKACKLAVDEYIDYVVCGLINLANIFHPDVFVLGGGVSCEGKYFIAPIQEKIDRYLNENNFYPRIEVVKSVLDNTAGIIGAASLVME